MDFVSTLQPQGHLMLTKVYNTGEQEIVYDDHNVITLAIKRELLTGLYKAIPSDPITDVQVGTGGTIDPVGKFPKQVDQTVTGLYSELINLTIGSYTLNQDQTAVTFLTDLTSLQGNGHSISEVGLFTQQGTLFAYKTFPAIPKTQAFSIHVNWTIKYT